MARARIELATAVRAAQVVQVAVSATVNLSGLLLREALLRTSRFRTSLAPFGRESVTRPFSFPNSAYVPLAALGVDLRSLHCLRLALGKEKPLFLVERSRVTGHRTYSSSRSFGPSYGTRRIEKEHNKNAPERP